MIDIYIVVGKSKSTGKVGDEEDGGDVERNGPSDLKKEMMGRKKTKMGRDREATNEKEKACAQR